jgi:hypothetical protein
MQPQKQRKGEHVMTQHNLLDAIQQLLPYAEAEQESLYHLSKQDPEEYEGGYENCRHAVSYAYEALSEATRKPLPGAASTARKHTPAPDKDLLIALEELADAAQAVVDNWSQGDLAAAVRTLDAGIPSVRDVIAKAKT